MVQELDSDRALASRDADEFGFANIAKSLAPRIVEASQGDGLVIGLEGAWGSGKSSLMQLIRHEIDDVKADNVHTITVAPWLNGDSSSVVPSLLGPIGKILDEETKSIADFEVKKEATKIGKLIASYTSLTARAITPFAKLAGLIIPSAGLVGKAAEIIGGLAKQFGGQEPTVSALKDAISVQLKLIDHTFVVFLDDLDRLEPVQAVEVVRLIRSVADFPKIVYLVCYDREVLSNGLEVGLNLKDGDLFLQKIVQLTFRVPQLEPFELRNQFLENALSIYYDVTQTSLTGEEQDKLKRIVDIYGQSLSTPREVKLTLNAIRFSYPSIVADVYFPDFCMLQLLKVTRNSLYRWLEDYLSIRSVLASSGASVSKEERADIGKRLQDLLPSRGLLSPNSVFVFQEYIPGVSGSEKCEECVFGNVHGDKEKEYVLDKRLGSPVHYRFYFALVGPKSVLSDVLFEELLQCAKDDSELFLQRLSGFASTPGVTEIERLLYRLEAKIDSNTDPNILESLARGFGGVMDQVLKNQQKTSIFSVSLEQRIFWLVENCFKWIGEMGGRKKVELGLWMAKEGGALNWIVGSFFRGQLFKHGRVGNEANSSDQWVFSDDELDEIVIALKQRVEKQQTQNLVVNLPDIQRYLFGWINLNNDDTEVIAWVNNCINDDVFFLKLLESLRHQTISDKVYHPLSKSSVIRFLNWDATLCRLRRLRGGENDALVKDLEEAIVHGRHG